MTDPRLDKWTTEASDTLRLLWTKGDVITVIAAKMTEQYDVPFTRGSIASKARRLKLTGRGNEPRVFKVPPNPKAVSVAKDAPLTATRTMLTVAANECRWPIGDPKEDGFGVCGRRRYEHYPYCAHHRSKAFVVERKARK